MSDKRMEKIKLHYDIYINDLKYKVIACVINEEKGTLSLKTKVRGQMFPKNGLVTLCIPSKEYTKTLNLAFKGMLTQPKLEHWEYVILIDPKAKGEAYDERN